ncbi:ArsC family reductase [Thalassotalea sp. M1531]|uniref:ArsC family reductase n=1 Tax=Thalassotalea algicola TaxID=2716224 RepID=A0A7Y0LDK1_9GAMM|nr:ArsC family reductase [Thalassotalea algicola]NMP32471.1 ArsC family reductase [Thalassotalea algicola]
MTTIYGIPNCDTVKKARKWLDENQVPYQFHDFRKDGLSEATLTEFITKTSWETLLNKRSTSYRNLPDNIKNNLTSETAKQAMLDEPTLIKRPVLCINAQVIVGFKADNFEKVTS